MEAQESSQDKKGARQDTLEDKLHISTTQRADGRPTALEDNLYDNRKQEECYITD